MMVEEQLLMRFLITLVCLVGPCFGQHDSVEDLLGNFRSGKDQLHAVGYMSRVTTPDPRILAGLVDLFDRTDDPHIQWQIAGAMLQKHDPNPRYFDILSSAMLSAIEANPPDVAFDTWCSELSLPIEECQKKYGSLTLTFLFMPASLSKDPRFIPIFRKGISARMYSIWAYTSGGLMMLGDKVTADEALNMGMIYKIYPTSFFEEEYTALATILANMPTKALGLTKRLMNQSLTNNLEEQLQLESDLQIEASSTNDYSEGVASFVEKRKPIFKGN